MIGRDRRRRPTYSREPDDLNVIPVMNLFMVLIPFLLLGAAFYQIGVIPTSTPTHDPDASDVPETPTTVAANLMIEEDGLRLTFASISLSEEELDEIAAHFPRRDGAYDREGLREHLKEIKQRYPESTTMTVLPYRGLAYQDLVTTLDATREYAVDPDDPETGYEELFPVTVFSRLITAEGGGEEGEEQAPAPAPGDEQ